MAPTPANATPPPPAPANRPAGATAKRDMSAYIRTYAKDVARLTNQPLPKPSAPVDSPVPRVTPPALSVKPPEPKVRTVDATLPLSTPPSEPAPLPNPQKLKPLAPEAPPPPLPARQIPSFTPSYVPPPRTSASAAAEDSYASLLTPSGPRDLSVPAPAPTTPDDDRAERDAVLARLREKVVAAQAAIPAPPPPPPLPPPPVVPIPAPPPPSPPVPTPPPPVQFGPDPLHTFSTDFADRIDREQASAFSVLAAQQDAAKRTPAEPRERRSFIPVVLATLLIVVGIGGITAAYLLTERDPVQKTLGVPSLIFADEKMELEGPDYRQALADATNEPLVEGNVLVTYITSASTTDPGFMREPQLGGVLIRALNLGAPDILLRNVDLTSTVGIIHAGTETRPFFILRVNSYERTFAGMLGWENRMLADLAPLYPAYTDLVPLSTPDPVPGPAASTTPATISGTSTQASTASPALPNLLGTAPSEFQDFVVVNRDVRALKDRFGRTLVLYGYADAQTLIVARDEAAFAALVARLAAATATN